MAKNYTLKEAANIIAEGKKKDEIVDIGRRFPLLAVSLTAVIAQANEKFLDFINYMPDHITANKINSAMKADIEETEDEANEVEEEAPKKSEKKAPAKKVEKKAEAEAETDANGYESMSGAKLYEMIKEAGKLKDLKAKGFGTKKADLIAYLEQNPLDGAEADEAEEEAEGTKYDDMNAMQLFKECKKRGIKAAPKKPAKFYIDLLVKADEAQTDAEDDEENWDDEPEEKPAKKSEKKADKKAEKPAKKATKKAEPEPEEDEDDGDDWDI